ncbi:hypothetical protein [Streptacidiphilus sp. PAMC 29251]
MSGQAVALVGLSGCVALLTAAAAFYLGRVRMPRPPVGVYTSGDVAVLCVGVVLAPFLYLDLPGVAVSALFGLVFCSAVQFTLAPLLAGPRAWALALAATAATGACAVAGLSSASRIGTDAVLALAVVGVANLWTQSGLRSAQVAVFAAVLACYDLAATGLTDVTGRFAAQVQNRPFAPLLALTGGAKPVGVGLGDLLLLVLFPLVATKAFGRAAGWWAAAVGLLVTSTVSLLFGLGLLASGFPLLTALGPLIVLQHLFWTRRLGAERSTVQWRSGAAALVMEPGRTTPAAAVTAALLAVDVPEDLPPGTWLAVSDGRVVGTGPSPGLARRDARQRGHGADALEQPSAALVVRTVPEPAA